MPKPTKQLIATKPFRYGTRHLVAGDTFDARAKDAKLLIAMRKAKEGRETGEIPPIPSGLADRVKPTPPALYGSSILERVYQIGEETVSLGNIVAAAHKDSGLTVEEWNILLTDDREQRIAAKLKEMQDAVAPADEEDDEEDEAGLTGPSGPSETETLPVEENPSNTGPSGATGSTGPSGPVVSVVDDLAAARAEYKKVIGRAPYNGWDAETLHAKIADFKKAVGQ